MTTPDGPFVPRLADGRLRSWLGPHRNRLAVVGHRSRQVLGLAGVTGLSVGLAVAAFDRLTVDVLLEHVRDLPLALRSLAALVGVVVSMVLVRRWGRGSPTTADEYVKNFHVGEPLDLAPVPSRLGASLATLGAGAPLGYEGPSIYAGAAIGTALQRRFSRFFGPGDRKVLMVAGAAAGVAAIFKAPVTGLVFALEVPYEDDLAHRSLLPAAVSSAVSYLVFAALAGTEPLLRLHGSKHFSYRDLLGAAVVGLVAGILANLFSRAVGQAKRFTGTLTLSRTLAAGTLLATTIAVGDLMVGESISVGPGYALLRWALDPRTTIAAIVAIATLRVVGTVATVAGAGVGGLFIPLVIQGALVGRAVGGLLGAGADSLFPVVGMAAFLGAGYRVPLAAVVFVAEFTGRPEFVVPGLIAAVVAQLVSGGASVSAYQRSDDATAPTA